MTGPIDPREANPDAVVLVSGRNEFQMYLMGLLVVSGLGIIFGAPEPGSVNDLLEPWQVKVWGVLLFIGGTINLIAIIPRYKDILTSLRLEALSLVPLFLGGLLFSVAVLTVARQTGSYLGLGFISVLAIASLWRLVRVLNWSRRIRNIRALRTEAEDLLNDSPGDGTEE